MIFELSLIKTDYRVRENGTYKHWAIRLIELFVLADELHFNKIAMAHYVCY